MIRLADFSRPLFFTGAGLSVESGIPTYRGAGGLWHEYDYRSYACQDAFERDPEKVWDFHDLRRRKVAACEPNEGHRIIAALPHARVITQNVDGLHQRAGSADVIELHGSLWRLRGNGTVVENFEVPLRSRRCDDGRYWRPDIVWFGDVLDPLVLQAAAHALEWCDLLVSIGTSASVYPAAELPRIALRRGVPSVEINPEETPVSARYAHRLRGTASEMLRRLME